MKQTEERIEQITKSLKIPQSYLAIETNQKRTRIEFTYEFTWSIGAIPTLTFTNLNHCVSFLHIAKITLEHYSNDQIINGIQEDIQIIKNKIRTEFNLKESDIIGCEIKNTNKE